MGFWGGVDALGFPPNDTILSHQNSPIVTFDRKIKRSDLNVVISRSRLSTCSCVLNVFLFRLSSFIGSVQVNGPVQLLIASLLTVPSHNG